jgi:uncharacterized protein YndB with AHSA1/START domain
MTKPEFVYMTVIAAPPEEVWKGLTTAEFTRQYWHGTRVRSDYQPGCKIEFLNPDDSIGVAGEIIKADHPEELVYTWQFTGPDSVARDDPPSRVSFRLERINLGTRLTGVHDQLVEGTQTASMITFGWPHVIAGLKTLLETGDAVDFTSPEEPGCPGEKAAANA